MKKVVFFNRPPVDKGYVILCRDFTADVIQFWTGSDEDGYPTFGSLGEARVLSYNKCVELVNYIGELQDFYDDSFAAIKYLEARELVLNKCCYIRLED